MNEIQTEAFAVALRADEAIAQADNKRADNKRADNKRADNKRADNKEVVQLINVFHRQTNHGVVVINRDGEVLAVTGRGQPAVGASIADAHALSVALRGRQATREREMAGDKQLVTTVPVLANDAVVGAVRISASLGVVTERTQRNWLLLAILGGVVSLVVSLLSEVGDVHVRSAVGRLEQVLDNLLSNALDVAPNGTAVWVEGWSDAGGVALEVRDAGPGMTPGQQARAFDRFWRADPSCKDRGGSGLGLAIVRRLVTADGGTVTLGAAPEGGLAVSLRLLASRQPAVAASRLA